MHIPISVYLRSLSETCSKAYRRVTPLNPLNPPAISGAISRKNVRKTRKVKTSNERELTRSSCFRFSLFERRIRKTSVRLVSDDLETRLNDRYETASFKRSLRVQSLLLCTCNARIRETNVEN